MRIEGQIIQSIGYIDEIAVCGRYEKKLATVDNDISKCV